MNKFSKIIILILIILSSSGYAFEKERVWIYFTDKGQISNKDFSSEAKRHLSQESIDRRLNKPESIEFDLTDLPVNSSYIKILKQRGVVIIHKLKWFNAVSAFIDYNDYTTLRRLNFVKSVEPVKSFKFTNAEDENIDILQKPSDMEYGNSFSQNNIMGVPEWHSRGYNASGVRIALFDSGFETTHDALQSVNVVAEWDFVDNDGDVGGFTHGTKVLSVIGGYSPGSLIGPAYGAEYLLARTEDINHETHIEEDNWAAAAEWADSLGADIISSSVGYNVFDPGEGDYTYQDMDGNTTIVTRAADLAVKKGIVVFSSAGNEGGNYWNYIIAPADGDSVIAVGNVSSSGFVASNSSRGPTYDGRIKPDFVAQGSAVYMVRTDNNTGFTYSSGTSYSTPLAAGAGALVLSLEPQLTPMELYDLLIKNASHYCRPDTNVGYGIINIKPILGVVDTVQNIPIKIFPNPFKDYTIIKLKEPLSGKLVIFDVLGRKIKTFDPQNSIDSQHKIFPWDGYSDNNQKVASGMYFVAYKFKNSLQVQKLVYIR